MSIPESQKLTPRRVIVQLGRKCNLSCAHCYLGENQDVAMSEEVMDAFLDNCHYLEEITLFGGEPALFTHQAQMLLQKLKERKMPLNYISVNTNGVMCSEALVKVFNDFVDYSTFSSEAVFIISWDRWHEQSLMEKFPRTDIEANLKWYQERLHTENVNIENEPDVELIKEGRAQKLLYNPGCYHLINIGTPGPGKKNFEDLKHLKEVCAGPANLCGHGCVHNCVSCDLHLTARGDLLLGQNASYERQDQGYYRICNVLEQSVFDGLLDLKIAKSEYEATWNPLKKLKIKSNIANTSIGLIPPAKFIELVTDEFFIASDFCAVGDYERAERLLIDISDRFDYYRDKIEEAQGEAGWKKFTETEDFHKLCGAWGALKVVKEDFNKLKTSGEKRFLEHFERAEDVECLESSRFHEKARDALTWEFCTLKKVKNPET